MSDEDLRILENILLKNPKVGKAISGTGGIRKIRIPLDEVGKRGGGRVMGFYEDIEKSLMEAIEMEKGSISLEQKENMPAPTYVVTNRDADLIDELVRIRKEKGITQNELAKITGNKQQAISRIEKKEHSPSLNLFYNLVSALGYELHIVKRNPK